MSLTFLHGVVAHIVSHADGVVNDKAALTQKLTIMGAAVANRFSGLVTHVIFRRKPQACKEERHGEGQALFELYTRIDKVSSFPRCLCFCAAIRFPCWIALQIAFDCTNIAPSHVCNAPLPTFAIGAGSAAEAMPDASLCCGAILD